MWAPDSGHAWHPDRVVAHVRSVLGDLNARTDRRLLVHTHLVLPDAWTTADSGLSPRVGWQGPDARRSEALGEAAVCPITAIRWQDDDAGNGRAHPDDVAAVRTWLSTWPLRTDALLVCGSAIRSPAGVVIPLRVWLPRVWLVEAAEDVGLTVVLVGQATADQVLGELTECLQAIGTPPATPNTAFVGSQETETAAISRQIARLRAGRAHKVVWSQVRKVVGAPSRSRMALELRRRRPNAWRIDVQLPDGQNYLFASPELLARVDSRRVETMALAGTGARQELSAGGAKLAHEHGHVLDFLEERLAGLGVHTVIPEAKVTAAGPLNHLQTRLSGERPPGTDALDVVLALHPTPALLGLPRIAAQELVEAEETPRGLYGGCVARLAVDHSGDGEAVVILRGAEETPAGWQLRAGAGLVAESAAAAEAAEIDDKFRAIADSLGLGAAP